MRIIDVGISFPSKCITNEEIISQLDIANQKTLSKSDRIEVLRKVDYYLKYSGASTRYWLAENERPIDLLKSAVDQIVENNRIRRDDIEMVIFNGVDRPFLEPSSAHIIAKALGLSKAQCFDVAEACMSWCRSASVAYNLLRNKQISNVLILNCEFNQKILNSNFTLNSPAELEWSFPAYTVGSAASAVLLESNNAHRWDFHFTSYPNFASLSTLPLEGYENYCEPDKYIGRNGALRFTCYANKLFKHASNCLEKNFLEAPVDHANIKVIFPHTASKTLWLETSKRLNIENKLKFLYPRFGNLVSASIPVGIAIAQQESLINRGDYLAAWVASAGSSFATIGFVY